MAKHSLDSEDKEEDKRKGIKLYKDKKRARKGGT